MITSPSLDGVLSHESIMYEGIVRPTEIIRAFDKPQGREEYDLAKPENRQILRDYYNDLYGLFMRKMGLFISEKQVSPDEELKLQAILQELIKMKKVLTEDDIV